MNICVQIFMCFVSLGLAGPYGSFMFSYLRNCQFFKVAILFYSPESNAWSSSCSTILPQHLPQLLITTVFSSLFSLLLCWDVNWGQERSLVPAVSPHLEQWPGQQSTSSWRVRILEAATYQVGDLGQAPQLRPQPSSFPICNTGMIKNYFLQRWVVRTKWDNRGKTFSRLQHLDTIQWSLCMANARQILVNREPSVPGWVRDIWTQTCWLRSAGPEGNGAFRPAGLSQVKTC